MQATWHWPSLPLFHLLFFTQEEIAFVQRVLRAREVEAIYIVCCMYIMLYVLKIND